MTADPIESGVRIVLISLADGLTEGVPVGSYLASYNPEGAEGNGIAQWTSDPAQAMIFPTSECAMACYRTVPLNRPLRPDGKPNRPLTVYSVAFWYSITRLRRHRARPCPKRR